MPPRRMSRFTFCTGLQQDGLLLLNDREPFRYRTLPDNVSHRVVEGDTLFTLAARYYAAFPRPAGLWWVIADFQPDPILDPTVALAPGSIVVVPSAHTVTEQILSESRRDSG